MLTRRVFRQITQTQQRQKSYWNHLETVGLDAIKQLTIKYQQDPSPKKVLLGEGVYKDDNGKNVVLKSVREAEKRLFESNLDHDYAAVGGVPAFCGIFLIFFLTFCVEVTRNFCFSPDSSAVKDGRVRSYLISM
jgi:aspartate/tyrosine/aromatic aminotransferase